MLKKMMSLVVCGSLLAGCSAESELSGCDGLTGKRFLSTALYADLNEGFPGHVAMVFSAGAAEVKFEGKTLPATYTCKDEQLQLAVDGQAVQDITLTPTGFTADIAGAGAFRFDVSAEVDTECFIPHGQVLQAQTFADAPFDYLIFHAFQAKVDAQKGDSVASYFVDCDTEHLHIHRSMADEQPLTALLGVSSSRGIEGLTLQHNGASNYFDTGHGFAACELTVNAVCGEIDTGESLLFPNSCFAEQVAASAVAMDWCSSEEI